MEENVLVKRIGDEYLNSNYADGQILTHEDLNELVSIVKSSINENYYEIQKLENGEKKVGSSDSLDGAKLSRLSDSLLQNDDNTIPSSQQVKTYIDAKIEEILQSLGG